jgi:hypothetical protein
VGREGCPASCAHPQRVPLLPWCSNPSPSPRAPRSMPARVCTRLSLVRAVPSCVPISAAAPPLRLQGCKRFCISLFSSRLIAFFSRLIAFESVPPRNPNGAASPSPKPRRASRRRLAASAGCARRPPLSAGERGETSGGGLPAPARAGPPRVGAPPGPPWQGRRQAGSVGRVGRPQAWAPAGAGWPGVGGRGRVGRREKWLYFSYTHAL